ncbi:Glutathione S-transferase domain [Shewanella halifaxensis HAW-EB4]|uniref:Glutathione S-transferase domain n=1 Tax=Shewanella halifaxensis (strain HAW-EB4) TaxID=458817 RepID=B0TSY7_SHEHH|nr:glutathione binding-like protein [Shewanella halifaxensis]ABZ76548.1 Glutathione S-transferase domain [Shewanella halifaxensis HAW-EB4]
MSDIQLYSLGSPNGIKIPIALEEMGMSYDAHTVDILKGEQFSKEFTKINPNSKIPAIIDTEGPQGQPISIMESGAILLYLAEKSGKLIPQNPRQRCETIQWLFFQASAVGPMFGAFGHFHTYGKENCDHPYPEARFANETKRLLSILDERLQNRIYIVGDEYSIADISIFPWVIWLDIFYKAAKQLELGSYKNVMAWVERCRSRPATIKGLNVYGFNEIGK